jgi:F0F1-type ATP synthase assembly protein I
MSGVFLKFWHLWLYSSNGYGFAGFDILSLICFMHAEICLESLFMLFAYGWTLSFQDIDWDNNLEFYLPVGSIVVAVHLVLAAMTYIDIDAYHKYHDYSGIQGFVLVFLRLCLFAYYIYCYRSNRDKIPKRSIEIYRYFLILGCLYFMIIPGTVFLSYSLQEYNRQYFYSLVTNLA